MTTSIIYGLYAAGIGIVVLLISYFTDMSPEAAQMFGNLSMIALVLCIYFAIRERRTEDFDGNITTGEGVGTGLVVGLIAGIVAAIFMYVYATRINPEFVERIREAARVQIAQNKDIPAANRDQAEKMMELFSSAPIMAIATLLIDVLVGLCVSLIVMVRKIGYVFVVITLIIAAFSAMGHNTTGAVIWLLFALIIIAAEILSERWRFPRAQPV